LGILLSRHITGVDDLLIYRLLEDAVDALDFAVDLVDRCDFRLTLKLMAAIIGQPDFLTVDEFEMNRHGVSLIRLLVWKRAR
jgi:hypothetical protein